MNTLRLVAHYLFNGVQGNAPQLLQAGMWGVDSAEKHRDELAAGDLVLIYVGAPVRAFMGCGVIASPVRAWTPAEAEAFPGDAESGVTLAQVEKWDPPIPMSEVLSRIDRSAGARADFDMGVVRITANEYETAIAVAAGFR